jgi:hypothetical protein
MTSDFTKDAAISAANAQDSFRVRMGEQWDVGDHFLRDAVAGPASENDSTIVNDQRQDPVK